MREIWVKPLQLQLGNPIIPAGDMARIVGHSLWWQVSRRAPAEMLFPPWDDVSRARVDDFWSGQVQRVVMALEAI